VRSIHNDIIALKLPRIFARQFAVELTSGSFAVGPP
jgi:hypothetical protein